MKKIKEDKRTTLQILADWLAISDNRKEMFKVSYSEKAMIIQRLDKKVIKQAKKEKTMITYTPLPKCFGEGFKATFKGVVATIYLYPTHALIYTIESKNEGHGEVKEFLKLLREKYPEIRSSVPLSDRWAKVCGLNKIKIV